jgi:beta-glucosidase
MCAFNRINGEWSCGNSETLKTDLKERLGFQGFLFSDCAPASSSADLLLFVLPAL